MHSWLILGLVFLGSAACTPSTKSRGNQVVVDVNGRQLTAKQLARELAFRLRDHDALTAKDPKVVQQTKESIVQDFVVLGLSETWALESGVTLKAEDLEKKIQNLKNNYPDELAFQQALLEQGLNLKEWRDAVRGTELQRLVQEKITAEVRKPTEAEIQKYYQDNREKFRQNELAQIRQILVATDSDAQKLEAELKRGARFAELAKKFSISPEGPEGGMVGWVEKGLTDIFESAFRMRTGQRSPAFKSSFGYHIFEVVGRKPARVQPLAEVKKEIQTILMEKAAQAAYLSWLEQQTRRARVFKDQQLIDALRVETKEGAL
jgi:peptidyl-prolyl cis-trans isomerase C